MPRAYRSITALLIAPLWACEPRGEPVADSNAAAPAAASVPSLYDRMGGMLALHAVVDSLVAAVSADARINKQFQRLAGDTSATREFKQKLVEQFCQLAGGPCTYTGMDMKSAHNGMNLRDGDFDALMDDLEKVLDRAGVSQRDKDELLGHLAAMRTDIVTKR